MVMHQTLQTAAKSKVQKKSQISSDLQNDLVCQEVLKKLGKVSSLHGIVAYNVFDNKWRVNVWVEDWSRPESISPSYKIKYSFFCTVQDNCISHSNPEILPKDRELGV